MKKEVQDANKTVTEPLEAMAAAYDDLLEELRRDAEYAADSSKPETDADEVVKHLAQIWVNGMRTNAAAALWPGAVNSAVRAADPNVP